MIIGSIVDRVICVSIHCSWARDKVSRRKNSNIVVIITMMMLIDCIERACLLIVMKILTLTKDSWRIPHIAVVVHSIHTLDVAVNVRIWWMMSRKSMVCSCIR